MTRRKWSARDIDSLFRMREVQHLTWGEIAERVNDTETNVCMRYSYYRNKRRVAAMRRGQPLPEFPKYFRAKRGGVRPPVAAPAVKPCETKPKPRIDPHVHRPRYFHEADMDIIARIDRQGLTAGFLGDPPAGRSALDQKQAGMT